MQDAQVFDGANYLALYPEGRPLWHHGTGSITYSFAQSIPMDYAVGADFVVGGQTFANATETGLSQADRAVVELAVVRLNEVANLRLAAAGDGDGIAPGAEDAAVTGGGTMMRNLGGAAGFGEITLPRSDDGYHDIDISTVFLGGLPFFGTNYTHMFANTNGSVSFGAGILNYSSTSLSNGLIPTIAPFWADVDTRAGGTPRESGQVHVDVDAGRRVVTVTWDHVNYYDRHGNFQNSFQLQLFNQGGGRVDVVFRYENIDWATGDASGGVGGVGGTEARAGLSSGDGEYFYELFASGSTSRLRALDTTAGNTGVTGLWKFSLTNGEPQAGAISIGALDFTTATGPALANAPGSANTNGDIWLDRDLTLGTEANPWNSGWSSVMQSFGRALGLTGTGGAGGLPTKLDSEQFSMMSPGRHPDETGRTPAGTTHAATPMLYDIQALQIAYGANTSTRTGDDVYFTEDGVEGFGIGRDGRLVATIWDAGGIDTFSARGQTRGAEIDLRPGAFSSIGAIENNIAIALGIAGTRARNAWIENAEGGSGRDLLIGNGLGNRLSGLYGDDTLLAGSGNDLLSGGEGDDALLGGGGNDRIVDGQGSDRMRGASGNDRFVMVADGAIDVIADFRDRFDRIDLSAVADGMEDLRIVDVAPGMVRVLAGGEWLVLHDDGIGRLDSAWLGAADFVFG